MKLLFKVYLFVIILVGFTCCSYLTGFMKGNEHATKHIDTYSCQQSITTSDYYDLLLNDC